MSFARSGDCSSDSSLSFSVPAVEPPDRVILVGKSPPEL
jgi:hypothetical protein